MKVMHLTEHSLRRLLDGTIEPAEARTLAAHLESDCPQCEELLASSPAGVLDTRADRALAALTPTRLEEAGNDLEYARIRRRVGPRRASRSRWVRLAALAASLAAAGGLTVKLAVDRAAREARWDGAKGISARPSRPIPLRLRAVAVISERSGHVTWKVVSGEALPSHAALQIQLEVGSAADVAIARVGPAGDVDAFWHERVAAPGRVQISIGGRPAAYPLAGLVGPQRLVAIASPEPVAAERVEAAARALAPPSRVAGESPALEGLSLDVLEVTVR